jgi:hypothetical protein
MDCPVSVFLWLLSKNLTPAPLQPGASNNPKSFLAGEGSKERGGCAPSQNLSLFQTMNIRSINNEAV